MGAHLSACTIDDDVDFGCTAINNGKEDFGDVYPSMDSVYPATSTATFRTIRDTRSALQSPIGSPIMSPKPKNYDSIVVLEESSPEAKSVAIISPLSMTSKNRSFCFDDGALSDTQSVLSMVSPTKDRRIVLPLTLRIPVLRPAGLYQHARLSDSIDDSHKPYYEQGHVEKFFDAPMFEAKEGFFTAILRGDLTAVQQSVEQHLQPVLISRITWPEHRDDNALHLAVRSGHLPVVQYLLSKMENALNTRNADGESPLSLAGNLRHYDILAHLMRWVVDSSRQRHNNQQSATGEEENASIISPFSPYASSSLQPRGNENEGEKEGDDVMSVLSVMMMTSVATIDDDRQAPSTGVPSDPNRVSNHLSRIFNEEEVMAWLTQVEEGVSGAATATSETEGDDRQSMASTLSTTSRLTMTDTAIYNNNSTTTAKAAGKKLPLPRGVRKAAGRAFRQIGRLATILPRTNNTNTHQI